VLNALQKTGHAHFHEFIEVIGGDGQEFYALQKGVGGIARLLQNTPVEIEPLDVAV